MAALLSVGALLLPIFERPAAAADSFYKELLRNGAVAFEQKNYSEAELNLRLACFGLLDDLDLLPEGLTRLALAQEASGNVEGFRETFGQILDIEERFGAYSEHPPEPAVRSVFEAKLATHVSETRLGASVAFEAVRRQKILDRLSNLPKGEQGEALDALISQDPEEPLWRLRRANLALAQGSPQLALPHLDAILAQDPNDQEARCLRGQSLVLNRCSEAVADLENCPDHRSSPPMAYDFADCLVEMSELERASLFLASLEGPAQTDRALSKLQRRVERDLQRQRKDASNTLPGELPGEVSADLQEPADSALEGMPSSGQETGPPVAAGPQEAQPSAIRETPRPATAAPPPPAPRGTTVPREPPPLSRQHQELMSEARKLLTNAQRAADLDPALAAAREVADARKDFSEAQQLAGEIAYRSSKWEEAARFFRRAGDPSDWRPNLLFFMAVSFYETGDLEGAKDALDRCLPKLQRTEFVESYRRKIQE